MKMKIKIKISKNNKAKIKKGKKTEVDVAMDAMRKLLRLREIANDGWDVNWAANNFDRYVILYKGDNIITTTTSFTPCFLAFKYEKTRDDFLEKHRDLIEKAKIFLS